MCYQLLASYISPVLQRKQVVKDILVYILQCATEKMKAWTGVKAGAKAGSKPQ
jgi:hypothetical protein